MAIWGFTTPQRCQLFPYATILDRSLVPAVTTATGTRVAAFNPVTPNTVALFAAALSGKFAINGLTQSNRRGTDPYARWCGRGGVVRHPPIPINHLGTDPLVNPKIAERDTPFGAMVEMRSPTVITRGVSAGA